MREGEPGDIVASTDAVVEQRIPAEFPWVSPGTERAFDYLRERFAQDFRGSGGGDLAAVVSSALERAGNAEKPGDTSAAVLETVLPPAQDADALRGMVLSAVRASLNELLSVLYAAFAEQFVAGRYHDWVYATVYLHQMYKMTLGIKRSKGQYVLLTGIRGATYEAYGRNGCEKHAKTPLSDEDIRSMFGYVEFPADYSEHFFDELNPESPTGELQEYLNNLIKAVGSFVQMLYDEFRSWFIRNSVHQRIFVPEDLKPWKPRFRRAYYWNGQGTVHNSPPGLLPLR